MDRLGPCEVHETATRRSPWAPGIGIGPGPRGVTSAPTGTKKRGQRVEPGSERHKQPGIGSGTS